MANPKIKNGYFPIANELAEQFAKSSIKGEEWRIIWTLWRKTWGFIDKNNPQRRKDWDWISITQFEKATNMKRANVHRVLQRLLAHKLILKKKNLYKFNQNYNEWVLAHKLILLAHKLTPISSQANKSVSSQATYKRKKETITKESMSLKYKNQYPNLNLLEEWDKFEIYNRDVRKKPLKSKELGFLNWLKKAEEFRQTSPEAIKRREIEAEKIKTKDLGQLKGKPMPDHIKQGRTDLIKKMSV